MFLRGCSVIRSWHQLSNNNQNRHSVCVEWLSHQGQLPPLSCSILLQFALGVGLLGVFATQCIWHRAAPHRFSLCRWQSSTAGQHCAADVIPLYTKLRALSPLLSWWSQLHPAQRRSHTLTDTLPRRTWLLTSATTMQVNKVSPDVCFCWMAFCAYSFNFAAVPPPFCPFFLFSDVPIHLSVVDGYMKTDDRMRLAKERREERERSLGRWCSGLFFFWRIKRLILGNWHSL